MSRDSEIQNKLRKVISDMEKLSDFISEKGTGVQYEVEFVGGTRPVDVPHTSAGHLAQQVQKGAVELFGSWEFGRMIVDVEDAERLYDEEYAEAVRDLDLAR